MYRRITDNLRVMSRTAEKADALSNFYDKLDKNKKYTLSDQDKLVVQSVTQEKHFKPKGLWYSCGTEWIEWVIGEMPHWSKSYIFEITTSGNIIKISNASELRKFDAQYYQVGIPGMSGHMFIDWPKVAQKYDGIEICPYIASMRMDSTCDWYYSWDVASGCIWNPAGLASAKVVAKYDESKDEYVFV